MVQEIFDIIKTEIDQDQLWDALISDGDLDYILQKLSDRVANQRRRQDILKGTTDKEKKTMLWHINQDLENFAEFIQESYESHVPANSVIIPIANIKQQAAAEAFIENLKNLY